MGNSLHKKGITLIQFNIYLSLLVCIATSCNNRSSSSKESIEIITNKEPVTKAPLVYATTLDFTSMIRSILHDSKGNYWFGSDLEGVCRYDGKTFTYFTAAEGMESNQIRTIQEDQDGNIWFATGNGVNMYDGEKITTPKAIKVPSSNSTLNNGWQHKTTDLWFNGEVQGGIYRYDGQQLSVLNFPKLDRDHESFSISGTVTGICKGQNNMLWMANYGGVLGFDGREFKYINDRKFQYHVRAIYEDSKGNLWIGNNEIGALLYNGDSTINFTNKISASHNADKGFEMIAPTKTIHHIFSIAEDKNGDIWFGDRDTGAWRYDGKYIYNYKLEDGLSNNFVRVIYKDRNGELWFGMEEGGVCRFNGSGFEKVF